MTDHETRTTTVVNTTHRGSLLLSSFALGLIACAGSAKTARAPAPAATNAPTHASGDVRTEAVEVAETRSAMIDSADAGDAEMAVPTSLVRRAPARAPRRTTARKRDDRVARSTAIARPQPTAGVKAGEWDDNANFREFRAYLNKTPLANVFKIDVSKRRFIVVRDKHGKGVPNCAVKLFDAKQRATAELTTTASGRALFFPRAAGFPGEVIATTQCLGARANATFDTQADDGVVTLDLSGKRALNRRRTIDIAFVLDTTGSMAEEIEAVKATIRTVSDTLSQMNVAVRIGLVEYRDRTDPYTTRVYPISSNISKFAHRVAGLRADGGGDRPEHMNEGLHMAVSSLAWNQRAEARLVFVISDAPPHLDYADDVEYTETMQRANRAGIQIFTVAASGMDPTGQTVLRQIAQFTGGTNMFVLRGGAGPQSTGGGDPKSSCGGTHKNYSSGNLDGLITHKIRLTLASLDADPTRIAGLHQDERAKPCSERLILAVD